MVSKPQNFSKRLCAIILLRGARCEWDGGEVRRRPAEGAEEHDERKVQVLQTLRVASQLRAKVVLVHALRAGDPQGADAEGGEHRQQVAGGARGALEQTGAAGLFGGNGQKEPGDTRIFLST